MGLLRSRAAGGISTDHLLRRFEGQLSELPRDHGPVPGALRTRKPRHPLRPGAPRGLRQHRRQGGGIQWSADRRSGGLPEVSRWPQPVHRSGNAGQDPEALLASLQSRRGGHSGDPRPGGGTGRQRRPGPPGLCRSAGVSQQIHPRLPFSRPCTHELWHRQSAGHHLQQHHHRQRLRALCHQHPGPSGTGEEEK